MLEIIFISISLVLIIEGTIYFFIANKIHSVVEILKDIEPKKIKNISLIMVFTGFCLIYFIIRTYK